MRCSLTTRLARHSPEMLPTANAGWNRHQLAANVSVPAAIRGGDQVSEETHSELITPASKFRMLLHTNPTRERGECLGTRAGASEDM